MFILIVHERKLGKKENSLDMLPNRVRKNGVVTNIHASKRLGKSARMKTNYVHNTITYTRRKPYNVPK